METLLMPQDEDSCLFDSLEMPPIEAKFWKYVNKDGPIHPVHGQCWIWTARQSDRGYGIIVVNRVDQRAHRFSWELHYGNVNELYVLHKCDNRLCVRPPHLFLGTLADNVHDMCDKGRQALGELNGTHTQPERRPRGTGHGLSKLTEDNVKEIRRIYQRGSKEFGTVALAKRYGVRQGAIWYVVKRITWTHI